MCPSVPNELAILIFKSCETGTVSVTTRMLLFAEAKSCAENENSFSLYSILVVSLSIGGWRAPLSNDRSHNKVLLLLNEIENCLDMGKKEKPSPIHMLRADV